jgi:hypothetical protein
VAIVSGFISIFFRRSRMVRNHPARSASVRIANAIRDCIANPSRLQQFATASRLPDEFTIDALGQRLQELGSAL